MATALKSIPGSRETMRPPGRHHATRLFTPGTVGPALKQAFVMLRPDMQWKNPVMFVVEVGAFLTLAYLVQALLGKSESQVSIGYFVALDVWLFLTVLFANFATGLAEARGRAQADSLKRTRRDTIAHRLTSGDKIEEVASTVLRIGDRVIVETGQIVPGDGEIVEGIASIDESAITGESAPVIREAGGDRSGVTGGTLVVSDHIVVRITSGAGESFLDRMIGLVEGAIRQRTPNEIALTLVLSAFTLIFLIVVIPLWPMALNAELSRPSGTPAQSGNRYTDFDCAFGLPDSNHDWRFAGRYWNRRDGPGSAGQHSGQERQSRRDRGRYRRGFTG